MTELTSLSDDVSIAALQLGLRYIYTASVPGDVVEFGCYQGSTANALAEGMKKAEGHLLVADRQAGIATRKLWLFDSFDGLPEATHPIDADCPHVKSGAWRWRPAEPKPTPDLMYQICSRHLPRERIDVVPGWYKNTLPLIPSDAKFAFVHIDCDLYESTYQVLDRLLGHDHLSDGCALFFDDWYCNRGNPKWGERKAFADIGDKYDIRITDMGPYGVVGHRFLVHR